MTLFLLLMVLVYLIGCLNTSILYSRFSLKKDIRTQGSGNAGATNMLRSFGKLSAAITFLGDFVKVLVAAAIVCLFYRNAALHSLQTIKTLTSLVCVLGHCFPIFFKFKGGKGIASGAACILIIDWRVCLIALALFTITVMISKYVSLGSIVGALTYPIGIAIVGTCLEACIVAAFTTGLVLYQHRQNIVKLFKGTENKITFSKSK